MKNLHIFYFSMFFLLCNSASGQSRISVHGNFNYWQHTEVFGPGVGFGYSYKAKKLLLSLNYDFGYGTTNRLNRINNVNYNRWSTVFIRQTQGKWNDFLMVGPIRTDDLRGSTDYGKQHQLSLQMGYPVFKRKGREYYLSAGVYSAVVEHFYTFTNVPIHYIELPSVYSGPLNYIPSTSQRILTYGINFEFSMNKSMGSKIWSPFIACGIGPIYSSFASVGVRLSTPLKKK